MTQTTPTPPRSIDPGVWRAAALVGLALLVGMGCGDEAPQGAGTAPACRLNSDCALGLVCMDGACVEAEPCEGEACPCSSDAQCGADRLCNLQTGACIELACRSDAGCPLGEVCLLGRCLADVMADRDRDGVPDGSTSAPRDNCPDTPNPDQEDLDGDGQGDACDTDLDGDGAPNHDDNCPRHPNPDQADRSGDGKGDACEGDLDNDGAPDDVDTCPLSPDPDQDDLDGDGQGDACDEDLDGDGAPNHDDTCPRHPDPDQADRDSDGQGDACEGDFDSDGVPDDLDLCPQDADPDQDDRDSDGQGDACDDDDDGDGVNDTIDLCPQDADPDQSDANQDGVGNACDDSFTGVTLEGQIVIADHSLALFDPLEGYSGALATLDGPQSAQALPDAEGLVRFEGLRQPGRYDLSVSWPTWQVGRATITLDLNREHVRRDLVAVHQSQVGQSAQTLRGRVLLQDQPRHSGVAVAIRLTNDRLLTTTTTDAAGDFAVLAAIDAPYLVRFEHPGFIAAQWPAPARWSEEAQTFLLDGSEPTPVLTLAWDRSATLSATLTSARAPTPFGDAIVTLTCILDPCPATPPTPGVNAGGTLTGADLVPGLYTLRVTLQGYATVERTIALQPGVNALGTIELVHESQTAQAVPVAGRALLSGRADHAGSAVTLYRAADSAIIGNTTTDAEGNFAIPASRFEVYDLRVARAGYTPQTLSAITFDGARFVSEGLPLEITLQPIQVNGAVTAWVTLAPGWIPTGQRAVQVQITRLDGDPASASASAAAGVDAEDDAEPGESPAHLNNLGAGTWLLSAARPGFQTAQQTVQITAAAPAATLRLHLALDNLGAAGLNLFGHALSDAQLRATPGLRGASLAGLRVTGAPPDLTCLDLTGVNLSEADLSGADLSGALLTGATLRGARLDDADLTAHTADCPAAGRPTDHHPRSTLLLNTDLTGASLARARLGLQLPDEAPCAQSPDRPRAVVANAHLQLADLSDAQLIGLELAGNDLSSALLVGVDLRRACLTRASFILANLAGATLDDADLQSALLVNAVLVPRAGAGPGGADLPTSARRADLRGATLSDIIAERADLSDARLEGANLNRANFIGTRLDNAQATGASFLGAVFGDALVRPDARPSDCLVPSGCSFADLDACPLPVPRACTVTRSSMTSATLDRAELSGVLFNHVDLQGSRFVDANLLRAVFIANFRGVAPFADLTRANLRGADLQSANLFGASCVGADLTEANLASATLTNASFSDCGWTGTCSFEDTAPCLGTCTPARLTRARLDGAFINSANLRGVALDLTQLQGVEASNADLRGATLNQAHLTEGTFSNASLSGADLTSAFIERTFFRRANLQGANLESSVVLNANLHEANLDAINLNLTDLTGSLLDRASLRRANLYGLNATQVSLVEALLDGASLNLVNLERADLTGITFNAETDWTSVRLHDTTLCPDGTPQRDQPLCNILRAMTSPTGTLNLTGALTTSDPRWARPTETCTPGAPTPDRYYDHFFVTNLTTRDDLTITASWSGGANGYLHVFKAPFDATRTTGCLAGDDDFNGQAMSQIVLTDDARIRHSGSGLPDPVLLIIVSTSAANTTIPSYSITLSW